MSKPYELPGEDVTVPVIEETRVVTEARVPGAAVVTEADAAALEARTDEAAEHVELPIYEAPLVTPTDTPEANLAARHNIVSDGPGTAGYIG